MKVKILLSIFFTCVFFVSTSPTHALTNVKMSARVGSGGTFTLYGYTSPYAVVNLEGVAVSERTTSRKDGYFAFVNVFSPFFSQETCVQSVDTLGRVSSPSCLPPFPIQNNTTIGPVIISPSISVDKGVYYLGEHAVLSGTTIPNTQVKLSFFKDEKRSLILGIIQQLTQSFITGTNVQTLKSGEYDPSLPFVKDAYATTFPQLTTKSDAQGNYSISIPTAQKALFRTFTQVNYQDTNPSQKSVTLTINVFPTWIIAIQFIQSLLVALHNYLIPIIILIELAILLLYAKQYLFLPFRLKRTAIVLYQTMYPAVRSVGIELLPERELEIPEEI